MKKNCAVIFMVIFFVACSAREAVQVGRIIATGDVTGASIYAAQKTVHYARNPKALERDIEKFTTALKKFRDAITGQWGEDEAIEPAPKEYVKYTQNYLSRASIDFDTGIITVETLDEKNPDTSLKNAIITTLLTPNDPRAVDLFTDKTVKLGEKPFLLGEVKDRDGKNMRWEWRAGRFADYLIADRRLTRKIKIKKEVKTVFYVEIEMVRDHGKVRALKYKPIVEKYAKKFSISKNLVYSIIKTESNFNPFAVSHVPAYGLMQIVPRSAGRDVYTLLNKKDGWPSGKFLFNAENNIQYGCAYIHILNYKYLAGVKDPVSREYCVISAYNTGAGNVFKTFSKKRKSALYSINSKPPLEVYNRLKTRLPYVETRRYLVKVMNSKKEFVGF